MIGRRLFAKWGAAAPIAIGVSGQFNKPSSTSMPSPTASMGLLATEGARITNWPAPKSLDAYYQAMGARNELQAYKREMHDVMYMPQRELAPSIQALKSVSPIYKLHMEVARRRRLAAEHKTWQQQLIESLGLAEYFAKRDAESPAAQVAGRSVW